MRAFGWKFLSKGGGHWAAGAWRGATGLHSRTRPAPPWGASAGGPCGTEGRGGGEHLAIPMTMTKAACRSRRCRGREGERRLPEPSRFGWRVDHPLTPDTYAQSLQPRAVGGARWDPGAQGQACRGLFEGPPPWVLPLPHLGRHLGRQRAPSGGRHPVAVPVQAPPAGTPHCSACGHPDKPLKCWDFGPKPYPCVWRCSCSAVVFTPPFTQGQPLSVGLFLCRKARARGGW